VRKDKKLKTNKPLLSLFLNHFHQEHKKNKTLQDSDSNSSHNNFSNIASFYITKKESSNGKILRKKKC
jgi:hypothetical protein